MCTHFTHSEFADKILHINFKILTSFISFSGLIPNPPSCLIRLISDQETLAFLLFNSGPYHRKAEHSLSMFLIHPLGRRNAAIKKFAKLVITEFISCSLPAYDKNLHVQVPIHFLIFSTSGKKSVTVISFVSKGSPKYLTGSFPTASGK